MSQAQNGAGELYGHARAEQVIAELFLGGAGARELVTALQADVEAFEDGAEAHDDLTILAFRWRGPRPEAAPPAAAPS